MSRPNRNQLIEIVRNGDDRRDKSIVLRENGSFDLVYGAVIYQLSPSEYVARTETLDIGNSYVGIEAAQDMTTIDKFYKMFLEAWIKFKNDNTMEQMVHESFLGSVEEYEKMIDQFD